MSAICDDLRAAILQAAMQGKLTEQVAEDGDASDLLQKIDTINLKKNNKKQKAIKPIIDGEIPFDIPNNWEWVRLDRISSLLGGNAFKGNELLKEQKTNYVRVIRISDFNQNGIIEKAPVFTRDSEKYNSYVINKNDILMCMTGGTVGKCCIVKELNEKYLLNQRVANIRVENDLEKKYIYSCLISPLIQQLINESKNSTNDNISSELIRNFLIPIPPLAEQKRIVEKIDELMARVADLEQSADALASLKKSFPSDVRDALLQAAMQGKLTEQLPEDGDAGELLEQIKVEKEKLVAEGKIKKQKPLAPIVNDEIPFEIPGNWKWVRLWDLFQFINGDRGKNYPSKDKLYASGEIPFISAINMYNGTVRKDNLLYADKMTYDRLGSGKLNENDFAICIRGSLGKYCKYPYKIGAIASSLVIMRKYSELILDDYIDMYLRSPLLVSEIHEKNNGTAQPNLSAAVFASFLIPIPPLAEQKRIADCLNSLISNINTIEGLTASE